MIVIVDSLTGQGARFASKLGEKVVDILDYDGTQSELFLITRSWDFGKITDETAEFLERYADRVIGLAVSGNRNWGANYGAAGDKISKLYDIELVLKFEGSGFSGDVQSVKTWIQNYKEGIV